MKLNIERAILHALDPASGAPVLSAEPMVLDEEVREFLEAHFIKCLESDEVQTARLREESGFGQRMRVLGRAAGMPAAAGDAAPWADQAAPWDGDASAAGDNGGDAGDMTEAFGSDPEGVGPVGAFVDESRHLAEQIFQILSGNPEVPAGDLICMLCRTGSETGANAGKTYFAGLKMNYHDGFSHYYLNGSLTIVGQRALLPGTGRKLEEAFLVDLETLEVRILEKKYLMMDESREAYLSARILGCVPEISEKSKLMAVKKAMQKANKEVLGDRKVVEQELMSRMHGYLAEEEAPVISEMCREVLRDYPQVTAMVEEQLAAENIDPEATVQVGEKTMKRFEKQSVKTPDGIEVKIPADLFADQRAMEFIQNPDGTISLLIKNVLL
ncbi:MAG: nucleoid-associated protein [Firmicutes bacterium]|nr:nucleoid-associated protein [Bacillota bacterium]MDY5857315.1 nucleoid-associated protein [Anaerovoracaceae bacterium]